MMSFAGTFSSTMTVLNSTPVTDMIIIVPQDLSVSMLAL